jgi:hypothetical protein
MLDVSQVLSLHFLIYALQLCYDVSASYFSSFADQENEA